ncbi:MAG: hypothetical protein MI742_01370 [Desulfobacterales bacterium]|nr:hypothetical protein [Desulfobacterales bacterium]
MEQPEKTIVKMVLQDVPHGSDPNFGILDCGKMASLKNKANTAIYKPFFWDITPITGVLV